MESLFGAVIHILTTEMQPRNCKSNIFVVEIIILRKYNNLNCAVVNLVYEKQGTVMYVASVNPSVFEIPIINISIHVRHLIKKQKAK